MHEFGIICTHHICAAFYYYLIFTRFSYARRELDIWNGQPSQAFAKLGDTSPDTPVLKTWAALEQRELKALTTHPPANIFQEIIFWTEQGKLWKFPIDNEQGFIFHITCHIALFFKQS